MAREEHDREDILAEAVALVERAEIELPVTGARLVFGFRRDGSGSIYFDADPVYHFNSRYELRRAFADGLLVKAEHGRLVSLQRMRTPSEVQLVRHELSDAQTAEFLEDLHLRWQQLTTELERSAYRLMGQVPESADVVGRWLAWMPRVVMPARIAANPRAS